MWDYYPALRMKKGEYTALAKVASDLQQSLCPIFIIPPPKERDPEFKRVLTLDEIVQNSAERIGRHWPLRPAYLDVAHIQKALGTEGLKRFLQGVRRYNSRIAVALRPKDVADPVFRMFAEVPGLRIGLIVPYEPIDPKELAELCRCLGRGAESVTLFVNFHGAPLDVPGVAGAFAGILEQLWSTARWGGLVFQASMFPAKNPAQPGKTALVARSEWIIFEDLMRECAVPPQVLGFSDFGVDTSRIVFQTKGGGRPIAHIRYSRPQDTLVVRGADEGIRSATMVEVCRRIVSDPFFAGQAFSYADDEIWRIANGIAAAGDPSRWRELGMAHHITRVVRDIGERRGVEFQPHRVRALPPVQEELFGA